MNNNYIKRHDENIDSANLLIVHHEKYCSSVHCSYYAVFQLILHVHKIKDTSFYRDRDKMDRQGSHERIINETITMISRINQTDAGLFARGVGSLRNSRVTSDYKEIYVDAAWSKRSFKMAQDLSSLLKDTFLSKKTNVEV